MNDNACARPSLAEAVTSAVLEQRYLDPVADALQPAVTGAFADGTPLRPLKDVLHGTWLGHSLHVTLTDVPVGAWTSSLVLDVAGLLAPQSGASRAADLALAVGVVAAVPTALAGLVDWSETYGEARRIGVAHATCNSAGLVLYLASLAARGRGARRLGIALSSLAFGGLILGAMLGGELSTGRQIGVNRMGEDEGPSDFVAVIDESEVPQRQLVRATAGEIPVLLYRDGEAIHAIGATCSHQSGPLWEGSVHGDHVTCPWHGSTFCLGNGRVVRGPAVFAQPYFETRVVNGRIEVRAHARETNV